MAPMTMCSRSWLSIIFTLILWNGIGSASGNNGNHGFRIPPKRQASAPSASFGNGSASGVFPTAPFPTSSGNGTAPVGSGSTFIITSTAPTLPISTGTFNTSSLINSTTTSFSSASPINSTFTVTVTGPIPGTGIPSGSGTLTVTVTAPPIGTTTDPGTSVTTGISTPGTDTATSLSTSADISTTPGGLPFPIGPFPSGFSISIPTAPIPPIPTALTSPIQTITSFLSIPPSFCAAPPTFTFNNTVTRTIFEPVFTGTFPSPLKRDATNKRQEKREARRYEQLPVGNPDTKAEEEETANSWQSAFTLPDTGNQEHTACFICSWERSSNSLTSEFYIACTSTPPYAYSPRRRPEVSHGCPDLIKGNRGCQCHALPASSLTDLNIQW